MGIKQKIVNNINWALARLDITMVRRSQWELVVRQICQPSYNPSSLPPEAESYLRPNNPRLNTLRQAYKASNIPGTKPSQWNEEFLARDLDMRYFRGDFAYVHQLRDMNQEPNYLLTAYYLMTIDYLGLLSKLAEDDMFGAYLFSVGNDLVVSRDLLDSITEIYFLEQQLEISRRRGWKVLDIGAGYGRLAHRMVEALPELEAVYCCDAVPVSTFISEFYLKFRGVGHKALVVPITDISKLLQENPPDLALNVHSFSECSLEAVSWWVKALSHAAVRYLMIAPNFESNNQGGRLLFTTEKNGSGLDFEPVLAKHGYIRTVMQPKYRDPGVQAHGISPTFYHLFELQR